MNSDTPPRETTLDYMTPGSQPPRWRFCWRPVVIVVCAIFTIFILFCSGVAFPIVGGATRDLSTKLRDDFAIALPKSAIVEHGARMAYRDPSYLFVVKVATLDLQPFIDSVRAKAIDIQLPAGPSGFLIVGPAPPAWFDVDKVPDLITFDRRNNPENGWRFGYSPSTGKIYIQWMSF